MEHDEQLQVLREQNKILRNVNSALRKTVQLTRDYSDALFLELCDATKEDTKDQEVVAESE